MDVGVDMDSVIADFLKEVLFRYNSATQEGVQPEAITNFEMAECVKQPDVMSKIWKQAGFFSALEPLPGAADALKALIDYGFNVFIVSAGSGGALSEKSHWLREHFPFMRDRAYFTDGRTPKRRIAADVLIDDAPHNLREYVQWRPNGIAIAASYPYTVEAHGICHHVVPFLDQSAEGWDKIVRLLLEKKP